MSNFGDFRRVKTRKAHKCSWCGQWISAGSEVGNYRGMYQDEWQNWHMHDECYEAYRREDVFDDGFWPYENERPNVLLERISADASAAVR